MNIAVCEDQLVQINLLNNHIENWAKEKEVNISIDNFTTAESFLFQWLDYDKYDIIFLDIKLSKMSGIELSNRIREKNKKIVIVFVTGFFKYALHGYKVGALQYLMKPINTIDLYYCLDKTLDKLNDNNEDTTIIVETGKKVIKLNYNEILYCIMFSPYIDIHINSEKIVIRKKISEMEEILPSEYFVRCHRSYIVNIKYIKLITKNEVVLENGTRIPISRSKYK
ncbi:MAG: LytR/AlgR family response regulator transcription factor, partial [Peptostreptococcaceae bacterium]